MFFLQINLRVPHLSTNIHSLGKSKQLLGLPLSAIFDPVGLSGTVRWSRLLLNEEVSSLDKEFKNSHSDVAQLLSRALQLFASEGAGEWTFTASVIDCPSLSAAAELLTMSIQDCLSLDEEEAKLPYVFTVFSKEEEERDVSLSLGEDEDACCVAYFTNTTKANKINHDSTGILYFPFSVKVPQCFKNKLLVTNHF